MQLMTSPDSLLGKRMCVRCWGEGEVSPNKAASVIKVRHLQTGLGLFAIYSWDDPSSDDQDTKAEGHPVQNLAVFVCDSKKV